MMVVMMVPVSPPEMMVMMVVMVMIIEILGKLHICLRRRPRLGLVDRLQQGGGIRYRFQQLGKRIGSQAISWG